MKQIAEELIETAPGKEFDGPVIHAAIENHLREPPLNTDVERAYERLADVGLIVDELERQ